ncbi:glycine oxidase ThiO [Isosphaeraceae bacterium EP7]
MDESTEVVIVGGGVIGLSIAYELARRGHRSTVVESQAMGRAASWAGAGMIAPEQTNPRINPIAALRARSAALFPAWTEWLRAETGIDNGYRRTGGVDVAITDRDELDLKTTAGRWRVEGIAYERLVPSEFHRVEPGLGPSIRLAYFLPDRAQIRNPRHVRALVEACRARGVTLLEGRAVTGFRRVGGRVTGVETSEATIPCGAAIVSAGAWSEALLAGVGAQVPTPPLKGQIVMFRGETPALRRIVEHGKHYLIPRDDGRTLMGATEEDAGFDIESTEPEVRSLIEQALILCPALAHAEVETSWAGLRPGSVDTRPYLGPVPGLSNLYVATGHKRAGLQQSPATAEILADLVLGLEPAIDLEPFRVGREPSASVEEAIRS